MSVGSVKKKDVTAACSSRERMMRRTRPTKRIGPLVRAIPRKELTMDIETMLKELGQLRREQAKRIQRKRQATHLLNAVGYLIVSAAVVFVLLSL